MITLTEILEYSLSREGQFLIPPSVFKFDMRRLEALFEKVVRQYEQYVPLVKEEFMHLDRHGRYLDAIAVKSLGFTGNSSDQIIPSLIRPTNYRYWTFDKSTRILKAQVRAWYLVKYLKPYTFKNLKIEEVLGETYEDQDCMYASLKSDPDLKSLKFYAKPGPNVNTEVESSEDDIYTDGYAGAVFEGVDAESSGEEELSAVFDYLECGDSHIAHYSGDLGDIHYNTETRELTIMLDGVEQGYIVEAKYITKYRGFEDLEPKDLLFDWFAAELFCGIGGLQAITQLEQSPVKWNSTGLLEYGRSLRETVESQKSGKSNWYGWLP